MTAWSIAASPQTATAATAVRNASPAATCCPSTWSRCTASSCRPGTLGSRTVPTRRASIVCKRCASKALRLRGPSCHPREPTSSMPRSYPHTQITRYSPTNYPKSKPAVATTSSNRWISLFRKRHQGPRQNASSRRHRPRTMGDRGRRRPPPSRCPSFDAATTTTTTCRPLDRQEWPGRNRQNDERPLSRRILLLRIHHKPFKRRRWKVFRTFRWWSGICTTTNHPSRWKRRLRSKCRRWTRPAMWLGWKR